MKETAQIPVPSKDPAATDDKKPDAAKATNPAEDAPAEELVRGKRDLSEGESFTKTIIFTAIYSRKRTASSKRTWTRP
jgi:hypothetical protein